MPVRIRYKVEVSISSSSSEEKDLGNIKWEVVSDKVGEGGGWKTLLAAGATDVQIPLDSITEINFLAIRTTAKNPNDTLPGILIRLNSNTGEQRTILPVGDCRQGHFLVSTENVISLFASNPGAVDVELTLAVAGD